MKRACCIVIACTLIATASASTLIFWDSVVAKSEIIVIGEIRTVLQEAYMPRWEAKGLLVVDSVMYSEKTHVGDTLHFKWEESRNNGITRGVFHQKGIWMIKPKGKDGFHTGYFRPIADIAEIEFMLQKKK